MVKKRKNAATAIPVTPSTLGLAAADRPSVDGDITVPPILAGVAAETAAAEPAAADARESTQLMARSSVGMALGPSSRQQLSVPAETAAGSNVQYRAAGQLDIQSPQSGQGIGNIVTLKSERLSAKLPCAEAVFARLLPAQGSDTATPTAVNVQRESIPEEDFSSPLTHLMLQCLAQSRDSLRQLQLPAAIYSPGVAYQGLSADTTLELLRMFESWCMALLHGTVEHWDGPLSTPAGLCKSADPDARMVSEWMMPLLLALIQHVDAFHDIHRPESTPLVCDAVADCNSLLLARADAASRPAVWACVKGMLAFLQDAVVVAEGEGIMVCSPGSLLVAVCSAVAVVVGASSWTAARNLACYEGVTVPVVQSLLCCPGEVCQAGAKLLQLLLTPAVTRTSPQAAEKDNLNTGEVAAGDGVTDVQATEALVQAVIRPEARVMQWLAAQVELNICTLYHEMRDAPAADVVPDAETAWACIRLLSAHSVALPVLRHVRVLRPALMIVKCTTVKAPRVLSRLEAATRSQALCCIANLACDPEALDVLRGHPYGLAELFACLGQSVGDDYDDDDDDDDQTAAINAVWRLLQRPAMQSIILDPSTRIGVAGLLTAWDDLWCARGVRAEIAAVLGSIAKATGAEHFLRVKRIWSRLAAMYGEAVPSLTTTSMDREAGRRLADLMMSLAAQSPAALSAFQEQRVCKQVAQVLLHELADTGAPTHSAAEQGETHVNMQHLPLRPFGACCSHLLEFMRPIDYCDDSIQAVLMQLGKCMLTSSLGEWSTSRYEAAASCFRVLATSIGHSPAVKDHLAKPTYLARAWHLLTTTFPSQNALSEDAAMQSCFYSLTALVTQLLKGTHPAAEASGQPPPETLAAALWDVCFWLAKQLAIRLNDLKVDKLGSEPVLREDLERWSLHTRDACRFFRIFVSYSRCGWLPELPEGSKATVMLILAAYMLARVIYKMMCKSGDIFDMLGTEPYALTRRVMAEAVRDSMGGMIEALASFQFARTRGHETVLRAAEVDMGSLREGLKLKSVRSRLLRPAACKQLEALLQAVQNTSQAEAAAQAAAEALLREEEAAAKRSAGKATKHKKRPKKAGQKAELGHSGAIPPAGVAPARQPPDSGGAAELGSVAQSRPAAVSCSVPAAMSPAGGLQAAAQGSTPDAEIGPPAGRPPQPPSVQNRVVDPSASDAVAALSIPQPAEPLSTAGSGSARETLQGASKARSEEVDEGEPHLDLSASVPAPSKYAGASSLAAAAGHAAPATPTAGDGHAVVHAEHAEPAGETNKQRKDRERKERAQVRRQDEALAAAAAADPAAMSLSQQAIRIGSVSVAPPKAVRQTKASASAKPTGAPTSAAEVNGTGHPAAFVKPPPKHSPAGNSGAPAMSTAVTSSSAGFAAASEPQLRQLPAVTSIAPATQATLEPPGRRQLGMQAPKEKSQAATASHTASNMVIPVCGTPAPALAHEATLPVTQSTSAPAFAAVQVAAATGVLAASSATPCNQGRADGVSEPKLRTSPHGVPNLPIAAASVPDVGRRVVITPMRRQVPHVGAPNPLRGAAPPAQSAIHAASQASTHSAAVRDAAMPAVPTGSASRGLSAGAQHTQHTQLVANAEPLPAGSHDADVDFLALMQQLMLGEVQPSTTASTASRLQPNTGVQKPGFVRAGSYRPLQNALLPIQCQAVVSPLAGRPTPHQDLTAETAASLASSGEPPPKPIALQPVPAEPAVSPASIGQLHRQPDSATALGILASRPQPRGSAAEPPAGGAGSSTSSHALSGRPQRIALVHAASDAQAGTLLAASSRPQPSRRHSSSALLAPAGAGAGAAFLAAAKPAGGDAAVATAAAAPASASISLPASSASSRQNLQSSEEYEEMCCPITHDLYLDPVIAEDGHTYDRAAIEEWFSMHDTSPMTNQVLASKVLIPNILMRRLIDSLGARDRVLL